MHKIAIKHENYCCYTFVFQNSICFYLLAYRYMGEDDSSDDEDGMGEEIDEEDDEEEVDIKPPTKKIKKEESPAKGSPAKRGGKK